MTTASTAHGDFATRLYEKLAASQPGKNLALSPFSIQVALAMSSVGASGETRTVLTDLIGARENLDEQNRQFAGLIQAVNGDGDRSFQLITANALWAQRGYVIKPAFKKAIAEFYAGAFNEVDFVNDPDQAVKTINAWVRQQTRDKIKDLINRDAVSAVTRLILTNAIYFKGLWAVEFPKENTRLEAWHGPGGARKVPMMHLEAGCNYHEANDFQALELPYKGDQLSMLVVLPRRPDGLAALETHWAAQDTYRHITAGLAAEETVIVSLPRFKLETDCRLRGVLCTGCRTGLFATGRLHQHRRRRLADQRSDPQGFRGS